MRRKITIGYLGLGLIGLGLYGLRRQFISSWLGLRSPSHSVLIRRGIRMVVEDGVNLVMDHFAPHKGVHSSKLFPTILIRTPYGRGITVGPSGYFSDFLAQRFAERGYHVIVQDVRGRFDSEGDFEPFVNEAQDGKATLAWIEKQPWFNGSLGMWGQSYLGYVQWALAEEAPLYLKALVPSISGSQLPRISVSDRAINLDTLLRWIAELDAMDRHGHFASLIGLGRMIPRVQDQILERAVSRLPLGQVDQRLTGAPVPFFQKWLAHPDADDAYWQAVGPHDITHITAAVHLVGGWYDILLRETLADYSELHGHGQAPFLTIGPWDHLAPECLWESLRQGLYWFDAHLKNDPSRLRVKPVRIFVMGEGRWREMDSWPPLSQSRSFFLNDNGIGSLTKDGRLTLETPATGSPPGNYVYDPTHPTPALGGALMSSHAGQVDNRPLETRPDVLTFTSEPLENDVLAIGPVNLILYVRSTLSYTDFFGRLCDVYPDGRSLNLCDGFFRIHPGLGSIQSDGSLMIEIDLRAIGNRFRRGHRIRLQVSSGAFPRWDRNPGTGEPTTSAVVYLVAHQTIYHDPDHPSALILPVISDSGGNS